MATERPMTTQEKLTAMNVKATTLFIMSVAGSEDWTCKVQYGDNYAALEKFELNSGNRQSFDNAVDTVYTKFMELTKHAFKYARPAQLTYDKAEDEPLIVEVPPVFESPRDDEVPF